MQPPFPCYVKTWHNAPYDAISPAQPALSAAGKTIIITGGGRGIGLAIAKAFAAANAAHIVITGRNQQTLTEARAEINGKFKEVKVSTHASDTIDEQAMDSLAKEVGPWDVLVLNAGIATRPLPVEKSSVATWWKVIETNLRGFMQTSHSFLPTRKTSATLIGISAGSISVPPASMPNHSAYNASKLAQIRLLECISSECPDLNVVNVHPGITETGLMEDFTDPDKPRPDYPLDDIALPGHFMVWAASEQAKFLNGRTVWANWDVTELAARQERIKASLDLTSNLLGWPFTPE